MEQTIENFEGTKIVENNYGGDSMGDVQAGIEFIYHMREHLVDVGVATIYLFACYTLYLWLKKILNNDTRYGTSFVSSRYSVIGWDYDTDNLSRK